jgi:hypothetical protein
VNLWAVPHGFVIYLSFFPKSEDTIDRKIDIAVDTAAGPADFQRVDAGLRSKAKVQA